MVNDGRIWTLSQDQTLHSIPVEIVASQQQDVIIALPSHQPMLIVDKRPEIVRENMAVNVAQSTLATAPVKGQSL